MSTLIKQDKKICTIYTDASFKIVGDKVLSSWAMYARCNNGRLEHSANFKNNSSKDPTHAEARAIFKAIKMCYKKWPDIDIVFVNTDSLAVCHSMWPNGIGRQNMKISKSKPESYQIIKAMQEWLIKHNLISRFKHVKAHTGNSDVRSWVNDRCDKNAKKQRLKSERQ